MTKKHKPTEEQQAAIDAYTSTDEDLMLIARAGAAKTTTLVMMAESRKANTLCLAFNKSIAVEMTERMPEWVESRTLSSLGYHIWKNRLGISRLSVNDRKVGQLISDEIDNLSPADRKELSDYFSDMIDEIQGMKTAGVVDLTIFPRAKPIVELPDYFADCDIQWSPLAQAILTRVLNQSTKLAVKGEIDYADMFYLPSVFQCPFPKYDCIMVDEAQDLSPINHVFLTKLKSVGKTSARLIVVGDNLQAIYGWRGADEKSLETLEKLFTFRKLKLTTSFRCSHAVIAEAQLHAADIRAWYKAAEGSVSLAPPDWTPASVPDGSAIICRNNAPLFRLAINMLKEGRHGEIVGRDVAAKVAKIFKKLSRKDISRKLALQKVKQWEMKEKERNKNVHAIADTAECLRLFIEQTETLFEALAMLNAIMEKPSTVKLMTGHKAKGLEFDDVFFYLPSLVAKDEQLQEANLYYVIQTRAVKNLTYIHERYEGADA